MRKESSQFRSARRFAGLLFILLLAFCVGCTRTAPVLRVLTYNVHHCEGTDGKLDCERIARVIREARPDVVALQELDNQTDRTGRVDQSRLLGELTGMHAAFGRSIDFSGGAYGNGILSRFPIEALQTHAFPPRPGLEARSLLAGRVKPGGSLPDFVMASTHLCNLSGEARLEQAECINALLPPPGEGDPIVLAGDFNARRGSPPMDALFKERWIDAASPESPIDYVLVRPGDGWRIVETTVIDDLVASDHRPVLTVLEWTGAQRWRMGSLYSLK